MLVIKRKLGESFKIDDNIKIRVERVGSRAVHLSIDAPKDIAVIRTEETSKPDALRNVQARLEGSFYWNNYGDVSRDEAARQEATKTAILAVGSPNYTWVVEVRIEGDDTSRAFARVQTSVAADVLSFESQEAPYRE